MKNSLPNIASRLKWSLDRGILGTTYIVKFNRVGNKILMIQPNYSYRAKVELLKKAVEQSFAQSTI
jgi:hypothetical protein